MAPKLRAMRSDAKYVEFVIGALQPLGEITSRRMFGGHAVYCDGFVFALIADGALFLKADDRNRPDFEARGLKPFQPFPDKPVVMSYFEAPPELFEAREDLLRWGAAPLRPGAQPRSLLERKRRGCPGRTVRLKLSSYPHMWL